MATPWGSPGGTRRDEAAPRGRLRVNLGFAPGAGTTCALLGEDRQLAGRGADVVAACTQTHGRPHTAGPLADSNAALPA